ncbi:DeoR family transcriptional regulator [Aureimonas endophytica]|uniref:DeoR family transcriptional regulator n=1 Tax=Aureimonas endophytica TaxID=2027858 RepID=A0A917ECM4_9HYPH|nr:DeoR/GlpR family DNA-binding transcription regulator [Aureimonas endophytica]GGE22574.1 DeoR family transcriptional regulator [Aureimonas endophytica]
MKDDRLGGIRQFLYRNGFSSVQDIAVALGASPATIRRDLQRLEADGIVARNHGGAAIAAAPGVEEAFEQRERENLAEKRAIAEAAFERIRPGSALFLDAGTTVLQLARRIRLEPMPLAIFTNGLAIAEALMGARDLKVTLIGGRVRPENASTVGPAAMEAVARLGLDQLFLGTGAVAEDGCLYGLDEDEAHLNALMIARASETVLLADASKFGRRLVHRVAPLGPAIRVVTDEGLPAPWRHRLAELACPVAIAAGSAPSPIRSEERQSA